MQMFGSAFRGAILALRKAPSEVWMEYGVRTPQKSRITLAALKIRHQFRHSQTVWGL